MEVLDFTSFACPHVACVLDSLDTMTLDWLTKTFLWAHIRRYARSTDGYTRFHQDRVCTAAEKLEQLISETHEQRVAHCDNPAEDILAEDKVGVILNSWKDDYKQWMRPETLERTWNMTNQQWHQALRKAFRSYLFQMVGSYEMVVFFIVAPFTNENLCVFRECANLDEAKQRVRLNNIMRTYIGNI